MKVEQVPLNGEFFSVSKYVRQKASIATVFFFFYVIKIKNKKIKIK